MYSISISQCNNGWILTVLKSSNKEINNIGSLDSILKDLMKNADINDDKLTKITQEDEYTGTRVFTKYKDMIGFLSLITD